MAIQRYMPSFHTPDGKKVKAKTVTEKRTAYNFYFNKILVPWFTEYIKPWEIVYITKYLRGGSMLYWGAVIANPSKNGKKNVANVAHKKETINATKFDEDKKTIYINLILEGKGRMMAAGELGVSPRTVQKHMVSSEHSGRCKRLS